MALFERNFMEIFGFTSSREKEARMEDYTEIMFPFGDVQKRCVNELFANALKPCHAHKMMFVFLAIKETFYEAERDGEDLISCAVRAHKRAPAFHMIPKDNLPYVFSLAMLDMNVQDPDELPDVVQVLQLQQKLFPNGYKKPEWTALPERIK